MNFINDGIVIDSENNQATIKWQGVGPIENFTCRVNGVDEICKYSFDIRRLHVVCSLLLSVL